MGTTDAWGGDDPGDVALVVRLIRGDKDAMAPLFERHGPAVHGLAAKVCGVGNADEVTQEVFLRLWQHPERFDPERGSLRTFLLSSTHGRAVDLMRTNGARRVREIAEWSRRSPANVDVEDTAMASLVRGTMATFVRALPRPERDAILLAYFGGRTYREVALLLKQPEGTVKGRIRSGLSRLRTEAWYRMTDDLSAAQ